VRALLESSDAFETMDPETRRQLAQSMVKVAAYLANPEGVVSEGLAAPEAETGQIAPLPTQGTQPAATTAFAEKEDPTTALKRRLAGDPGFAGSDFEGGAIRQGTDQFTRLVQAVDFPNFVSGLIQNVFQAIVDSSIQQMKAYGELLANVAKSIDDFARDNITENNARDWLSQRFPGQLGVETDGMSGGFAEGTDAPPATARVGATGEDPEADLAQISNTLQITPPIGDLSDENEELRLVTAARLQMARSRQQLLSSMVMLGINRIVVTDGLINAKVVFDMRAQDTAKRVARASMLDVSQQKASTKTSASYGSWFSPVKASMEAQASTDHMATVSSSVDDTSESRAEVKAKLTGEVRVNFKSDYMPMEKLATPEMIAAIQGNAQPSAPLLEGA
jgi:hypothetical protein